jgi:hypothetical protein
MTDDAFEAAVCSLPRHAYTHRDFTLTGGEADRLADVLTPKIRERLIRSVATPTDQTLSTDLQ